MHEIAQIKRSGTSPGCTKSIKKKGNEKDQLLDEIWMIVYVGVPGTPNFLLVKI
jgi:hypothetical protein